MATKAQKKRKAVAKKRNAPAKSRPKLPTLGGGLTGLGGTGAQGMMP